MGPIIEQLLQKEPWNWETVEIGEIIEGNEHWYKKAKGSDFKVWIKIIKKEVNFVKLGNAKTQWRRGRTQWPLRSVKAETVERIIAGFEYRTKEPHSVNI